VSAVHLTNVVAEIGDGSIIFEAKKMEAAPNSWNWFFWSLIVARNLSMMLAANTYWKLNISRIM
jgi:hypothetical protein